MGEGSRGLHGGGGIHLKYFKRGGNGKEGRGNKDFKKREQAGTRGGCLKGGEPIHIYTGPIVELHWVQLSHSI